MRVLVAADPDLEAGTEGKGQRGVADGTYVLVIQQVLRLPEDGKPIGDVVGAAEVEFGKAEVQVTVGQQKRVVEVRSEAVEEGRVVAATGVGAEEGNGEFRPRVLHRGEA